MIVSILPEDSTLELVAILLVMRTVAGFGDRLDTRRVVSSTRDCASFAIAAFCAASHTAFVSYDVTRTSGRPAAVPHWRGKR